MDDLKLVVTDTELVVRKNDNVTIATLNRNGANLQILAFVKVGCDAQELRWIAKVLDVLNGKERVE